MARISTYELDGKVNGGDKWIGTDSGSFNTTKNFTPIRLAEYFNSSEKIDLSNSLRFYYQIPEVEEDRATGTISFESFLGYNIPLSDLNYILLSKTTEGGIQVSDFLSAINNYKVLLHKGDSINVYGIYEVTFIEDWEVNADFLKVGLSFIRGNGELANGSSYLLSVVDFNLAVDASWGNITGNIQSQEDLQDALSLKANNSDLGEVAFSNDYNDLDNLPNIPSIDNLVPYAGATQNVDLGEHQIKAGQVEFDTTPTGNAGVGILRWNNSDGTLDLGLKGGNVTLQIGQEQVVRVVNKTGSNLLESNYQAVRVNGAQGQRLKVALAQATNDLLSAETIGLVTENIDNNKEGFVTTSGLIRGINTTGSLQGETWADGDMLYLSPFVAGRITNIKPSAPNHLITIGYVVYAHANNGGIFVKVNNGYELEELHNVTETNYTTPIDTDSLLTFDVNNSLWKRLSWANVKSNLKTYFDTIYQTALGFTPENLANKANDLTSPDNTKYPTTLAVSTALNGKQDTLTNPITGTGAINILPKFTGATLLGNSQIFDNGTSIGINTNTPSADNRLEVNGRTFISAGTEGTTTAPLIVRNTIPYQSPFSQFIQLWQNSGGSNIMTLRADGSLVVFGGGFSGPAINLSGAGTNTTNANMITRSGQGGTGISILSGHQITFASNSNERMRLDSNGNFVIGATTAGARLDVRAQGALSTDIAFRVRNSTDTQNFLVVNGAGDVSNSGAGGGDTNTQFGINVGRNRTGNYNSLFGNQAGRDLTTGASNTLFGYNAGRSITTASGNVLIGPRAGESTVVNYTVAVGGNALLLNQTGTNNVAVGNEALYSTTAAGNTALGDGAGNMNTTGQRNIFLGYASGRGNTTGNFNTFIGVSSAFYSNGSNNVFLGDSSGFYQSDGITNMTSANNSVFIGKDVKANSSGQTNQIVIGYNAIGLGTNTVVLGNTSITRTALRGQTSVNTDTIDASAQLQVDSTTRGFLPPRMTTTQRNAISTPAAGLIIYNTTTNTLDRFNGTTWNAFESVDNKVTDLNTPNNTTYPTTQAVVNENKKANITVELIDLLTTNFYAPNALRINSTALISGSGTITLKVNDVAYTLGNLITQGAKITVETTTASVYNLISVYE